MVDHLTTVWPARGLDPVRLAGMAGALDELGFARQAAGPRVSFTSSAVEARTAKAHLRARGFRDREFRLVLEYARRWGTL